MQARNPHEQVCGGLPEYHAIAALCRFRSESVFVTDFYQLVAHTRHDILPHLPTTMDNQSNLDLRISYLLKEIEEENLKSTLQKREKEREKGIEYRQFLTTFVQIAEEMFRQLVSSAITPKEMLRQASTLLRIINTQIDNLNRAFKSKLHILQVAERSRQFLTQ